MSDFMSVFVLYLLCTVSALVLSLFCIVTESRQSQITEYQPIVSQDIGPSLVCTLPHCQTEKQTLFILLHQTDFLSFNLFCIWTHKSCHFQQVD